MSLVLLQSAAPAYDNTRWIVIGLLAAMLMLALLRPRLKRKDPLSRPTPAMGLSQQRAMERDMSNLVVELSEMARQITAQIDTRAAKLEALIGEADERLAAMKNFKNDQARAIDAPTSLAGLRRLEPATTRAEVSSGGSGDPYQRLIEAASNAPTTESRHDAVYSLADEGRSVHQIAQQLDRPTGEVELILALRSARPA